VLAQFHTDDARAEDVMAGPEEMSGTVAPKVRTNVA
jgi:hypothetical protein